MDAPTGSSTTGAAAAREGVLVDQPAPTITLGLDGCPAALEAARYALQLAGQRHARLLAVTAYQAPPTVPGGEQSRLAASARQAGRSAQRRTLAGLPVPPEVRVEGVVQAGSPISVLRKLSAESSVVVVGSGVGGLGHAAGSPVADGIAEQAVCPVVVVPPGSGRTNGRGPVLVALDGDSAGTAAVRFAFEEAAARGVTVWVLHGLTPGPHPPHELAAERAALAIILSVEQQDHPDVVLRVRMVPGDPVAEVLRLSAGVGLVVVGQPHRPGRPSWRHSLARAVLGRTRCPLVVAPAEGAARALRRRETTTSRGPSALSWRAPDAR
jgi:nucleotide-binding universal stress UspA family protein